MFTPLRRPQVETLKSKYALESNETVAMPAYLRFGLSSMSRMGGHVFGSMEVAASRDFSNLMIGCMESTMPLLDTSTIMRTVGKVVFRFCGCGGLMVIGIAPKYRHP